MKVIKRILKLWKIYVIFILSILLSFAFEEFSFGYENILLLFIVSVVLVIMESRSYLFGFISALLFVLFFNFFFTEPKYTFMIEDSKYVITLIIFLIVSFLISSLMQKLHSEATRALDNERKTEALYNVAKGLLSIGNPARINVFFTEIIQKNTKLNNLIVMDGKMYSSSLEKVEYKKYQKHVDFAIKTGSHIGIGTAYKPDLPYRIIGVSGIGGHQVALIIETTDDLNKYEIDFLNAIINLYKIVMQKEVAKLDEESSRLLAENERFKNQILRSISHDLRTPLTSILTGSTLLYNDIEINDETRKEILSEIIDEVDSMTLLIENILQMTKFQNKEVQLRKTKESIDEIVSQASNNIQKRLKKHSLKIRRSDDVVMMNIDSKLMIQVLTNLIDNAIQHTKEDSNICIQYEVNNDNLHILVSDDGGGIKENDLKFIFESEYFTNGKKDDRRGFGLGLNICKAVVEKHNGTIKAFNNEKNGATFEIVLPL
jgi:two-component system sensor histidine kinase KdpD